MEADFRNIGMRIEVTGTESASAELYKSVVTNNSKLLMEDTCQRLGLTITSINLGAVHLEISLNAVSESAFENFRTRCEEDNVQEFVQLLLPSLASLDGNLEVSVRVDMQNGQGSPLQTLIQQNLSFLEEELDMFHLKERFIKTQVFSEEEIAKVSASDTRRNRSRQLLLTLSEKNENTRKTFLHVLLDAEEEFVFQCLLDQCKEAGSFHGDYTFIC